MLLVQLLHNMDKFCWKSLISQLAMAMFVYVQNMLRATKDNFWRKRQT